MEHESWQAGSLNTSTEVKGEVLEGDKEGARRGGELNGKAKKANNRDRRKYCTTGDRDAKEEKQ